MDIQGHQLRSEIYVRKLLGGEVLSLRRHWRRPACFLQQTQPRFDPFSASTPSSTQTTPHAKPLIAPGSEPRPSLSPPRPSLCQANQGKPGGAPSKPRLRPRLKRSVTSCKKRSMRSRRRGRRASAAKHRRSASTPWRARLGLWKAHLSCEAG